MSPEHITLMHALFKDFFLGKNKTEGELWDSLIRKTASVVGCHAATYFEADDTSRTLTFRQSIGPVGASLSGVSFPYQGIVGWCADNRSPILVNNVELDQRFTQKVDKNTGFKTKNAIAAPAIAGGQLLGVAEFINSTQGAFTEQDTDLAAMITHFAAQQIYISRLETSVRMLSLKGEGTIDNLTGGFIGMDLDGKILFFNPRAREIFETGPEYLDKNISSFFYLSPEIAGILGEVLAHGTTVQRQKFNCAVNGKIKTIGYSSLTLKDLQGKVTGAGIIFQDITGL